jgi:hypothetical protein
MILYLWMEIHNFDAHSFIRDTRGKPEGEKMCHTYFFNFGNTDFGSENFCLIPCVSGIMTRVASLLSQSAFVFWWKYWTEKYLLHQKVMLPHPAWQIALQFHNTYLGWTNQCNYYKIACLNMLWQHDFWMKPKNFVVRNPHWQQSMKVTIPGTLCSKIRLLLYLFCTSK